MAFHPHRIIRGALGETYHRATIEIAILLWERSGREIHEMPQIYVTLQSRGRAYKGAKLIQIPSWVFSSYARLKYGINYPVYYIAHELAHIVADPPNHGPEFMEAFREMCPVECQGYEYTYKPRNAKAAGVERTVNGKSF